MPVGTIAMITGHARKQEVPVLEAHYIHIADVRTLPERVEALAKLEVRMKLPVCWGEHFWSALVNKDGLHP